MADVEGLYIVTGVVLVALVAWVLVVLVRAPNAVDMSKRPAPAAPEPIAAAEPEAASVVAAVVEASVPSVPVPVAASEPAVTSAPATTVENGASAVAAAKSAVAVVPSAPAVVTANPAVIVEEKPVARVPPRASPSEVRDSSWDDSPAPSDLSVTPPPTVTSSEPDAAPLGLTPSDTLPVATKAKVRASDRVPTFLGLTAPVVTVSSATRSQRLDSHLEIQDSHGAPPEVSMPDKGEEAPLSEAWVLVTSLGFRDPAPDKSVESHAILESHDLVVFADGSGKKAGDDLASAIVVDAVIEAFEKNDSSVFADDPKLPEQANRIRRAALAANRRLLQRARESGQAGIGTSVLAAHFSADRKELFVAHVGANRAYCVRDGHVMRLTTPHGARTLGVIDRVDVEVVQEEVRPSDLYLFCSDTLGRAFSESELLASVSAEPSLEGLTRRLIAEASEKDDAPNLIVIAVRVDSAKGGAKRSRAKAMTVLGLG